MSRVAGPMGIGASGSSRPNSELCRVVASTGFDRLKESSVLVEGQGMKGFTSHGFRLYRFDRRLDMLENQCKIWPHTLAAAVYVPLLDGAVSSLDSPELNGISLAQALEMLSTFHARLQSEGEGQRRLPVVVKQEDSGCLCGHGLGLLGGIQGQQIFTAKKHVARCRGMQPPDSSFRGALP